MLRRIGTLLGLMLLVACAHKGTPAIDVGGPGATSMATARQGLVGDCPVGGPAVEVGTVTMDVGLMFGDKSVRGTMPIYGIIVQRIADGMGLWVCLDSGVLFVAPRQSGSITVTPYKTEGGGAAVTAPPPKPPQ
jgi:hypothetical protein